jgi:hypothetical protein
LREHRGIRARNKRNGESIAQRSQRSQRGNGGFDGEAAFVDTVASGREINAMGKASHRGHRGHGGRNGGFDGEASFVNTVASEQFLISALRSLNVSHVESCFDNFHFRHAI